MTICGNCFKKLVDDHPFCPFCGFPRRPVGLKQCNKGHVIYETQQTCPFCAQSQNLGKSLIGFDMNSTQQTGIEDKVKPKGAIPDKTVFERDDDEKTRVDVNLDNTIIVVGAPFYAWLVFLDEAGAARHDMRLVKEKSIVGKGVDADIRLEDDFASKLHALIHFEKGSFYIADLGSTNHTWVNDRQVLKEELQDGDAIRIGRQTMIFSRLRRNP